MDRIIGVVTTDYRYAKRFCDYINRSGRLNISAVPFESVKSCSDYGKKHRIELLIADRSLLEDEGQKPESIKAVKKIMLAEDTEGIRKTSEVIR